jgi:hypothetical protein
LSPLVLPKAPGPKPPRMYAGVTSEIFTSTGEAIVAVARPLGIAVHDHIIVGKDGHASLTRLR